MVSPRSIYLLLACGKSEIEEDTKTDNCTIDPMLRRQEGLEGLCRVTGERKCH